MVKILISLVMTLVSGNFLLTPTNRVTSASPPEGAWIRSDKTDDIETFYSYRKIGTDRFEVAVKVVNHRQKTVKVIVALQVRQSTGDIDCLPGFCGPPRKISFNHESTLNKTSTLSDNCQFVVPAGDSRVCGEIRVTAKKVLGVKIKRWDEVD
jgi:hypothetical protein